MQRFDRQTIRRQPLDFLVHNVELSRFVYSAAMSTAEENRPEPTEQEYYLYFLNALAGVIDDAGLNCYNREGIDLLNKAEKIFVAEFKSRHPHG